MEYKGEDGRRHDTRKLAKPSTRDQILGFVAGLRGVTLKVHGYVKGVKEYGKAPGF